MRYIFIVAALLLTFSCLAKSRQVDPKSLDSLKRSIEFSRKSFQNWQDSFNKKQDSLYKAAIAKAETEQNAEKVMNLISANKKRENKQQQTLITIGIATVFFLALTLLLYRRNKKNILP